MNEQFAWRALSVFAFASNRPGFIDANDEVVWFTNEDDELTLYARIYDDSITYVDGVRGEYEFLYEITEENIDLLETARQVVVDKGEPYGIADEFAVLLKREPDIKRHVAS